MRLPHQPSGAPATTLLPRSGLGHWSAPAAGVRIGPSPASAARNGADGALLQQVLQQAEMPAPPAIAALGETLRRRFAGQARAVLFYGSCRRAGGAGTGIVDLYVLVDDYRVAYDTRWEALANRVLAPNVYYLEASAGGQTVRAKYAVLSMEHFERGTSRWFHPYLWARFAQPCSVLYAADAATHRRVAQALAQAVRTFASKVLALLPAQFEAEHLWSQGLACTFATELRSEGPERIRTLCLECAAPFAALTRALAGELGWVPVHDGRYRNPSTPTQRRRCTWAWAARRAQGKVLSVLRLLKASLTFEGGMSYIAWKIERHSGVKVEITPFMRRFPPLGAVGAAWRTWRLGGFR